MLVDYERAWLHLKRVIGEKRSHGQKDLAVAMAELEVECMLDGDTPAPTVTGSTHGPLPGADTSDPAMPERINPLLAQEARNGNSEFEHPVR